MHRIITKPAGLLGLVTAVLVSANVSSSAATQMQQLDVSDLQKQMEEDKCPNANPPEVIAPPQYQVCGGDGTRGPCGEGLNFDRACGTTFQACVKQYTADVMVVNQYNTWIKAKCRINTYKQPKPVTPKIVAIPNIDSTSRNSNRPPSSKPDCHPDSDACVKKCLLAGESDLLLCTQECRTFSNKPGAQGYCFGRAQ
jgi:hypothetical protein